MSLEVGDTNQIAGGDDSYTVVIGHTVISHVSRTPTCCWPTRPGCCALAAGWCCSTVINASIVYGIGRDPELDSRVVAAAMQITCANPTVATGRCLGCCDAIGPRWSWCRITCTPRSAQRVLCRRRADRRNDVQARPPVPDQRHTGTRCAPGSRPGRDDPRRHRGRAVLRDAMASQPGHYGCRFCAARLWVDSFLNGTTSAIEMCAIANATGWRRRPRA